MGKNKPQSIFTSMLAIALAVSTLFAPGHAETTSATDAPQQPPQTTNLPDILKTTWQAYKERYIQDDGRVLDPREKNVSTSEGQSYALLRAVWMKDRATFDRVYQWSRNNLQQPRGDQLFAWRWGKTEADQWTVLSKDSASDADQDIALALILASEIWQEPQYKADALAILDDFWNKNTGDSPAGRVLFAGDWHNPKILNELVNPSYFAPYAYRVFAEVDPNPDHRWMELVDSSYFILEQATSKTRTGLPPNWVSFSLTPDKKVTLFYRPNDQRSDYGYDAIRVNWRIGLDHLLNPDEARASRLLKKSNFLSRYWALRKKLPGPLTVDGIEREPENASPSLAIYGASLMGLTLQDEEWAETVVREHILPSLQNNLWEPQQDYYAQNWLWFGLATYNYHRQTRFERHTQRLSKSKKPESTRQMLRMFNKEL